MCYYDGCIFLIMALLIVNVLMGLYTTNIYETLKITFLGVWRQMKKITKGAAKIKKVMHEKRVAEERKEKKIKKKKK